MQVSFYGGAGTVTGSKFVVESSAGSVLVDCGLFQGLKSLRKRNWASPDKVLCGVDAVVLSHAHIDHSGYLPILVRSGFKGPVYCTAPTLALLQILLPDCGRIQEEDAAYLARKGLSRHAHPKPLYTEKDAIKALQSLRPIELGRRAKVRGLGLRLHEAGHILGAASVEVTAPEGRLLFSGDLGRRDDPIMFPPATPPGADWVFVESTYGDRVHPASEPVETLASILRTTIARKGILLVPAFAVGRTQSLLYYFNEIFQRGLAPRVPVYLNSPMATDVTDIYRRSDASHRLDAQACAEVCQLPEYTRSVAASRRLVANREPCIIISASGMATGGRVLHHLRALLPEPQHTILLAGYQAPGTRGAALVAGAPSIKLHGQYIPVAAEVIQLGTFSAHADQTGLLDWLKALTPHPRRVFIVHGDPGAADAMRVRAHDALGCPVSVPEHGETLQLV